MNNDIEFECVPNALFKTYRTKKEISIYQINIYTQLTKEV